MVVEVLGLMPRFTLPFSSAQGRQISKDPEPEAHPSAAEYAAYGVTATIQQVALERTERLRTLKEIFQRAVQRDREERALCLSLVRTCMRERQQASLAYVTLITSSSSIEYEVAERLSSAFGEALSSGADLTGCDDPDLGCDQALISRARTAAAVAAAWVQHLSDALEKIAFRLLCSQRAFDRRNPLLPCCERRIVQPSAEERATLLSAHEHAKYCAKDLDDSGHGDVGPSTTLRTDVFAALSKLKFAAEVTETIVNLHHALPAQSSRPQLELESTLSLPQGLFASQLSSASSLMPDVTQGLGGSPYAGELLTAAPTVLIRPAAPPSCKRSGAPDTDGSGENVCEGGAASLDTISIGYGKEEEEETWTTDRAQARVVVEAAAVARAEAEKAAAEAEVAALRRELQMLRAARGHGSSSASALERGRDVAVQEERRLGWVPLSAPVLHSQVSGVNEAGDAVEVNERGKDVMVEANDTASGYDDDEEDDSNGGDDEGRQVEVVDPHERAAPPVQWAAPPERAAASGGAVAMPAVHVARIGTWNNELTHDANAVTNEPARTPAPAGPAIDTATQIPQAEALDALRVASAALRAALAWISRGERDRSQAATSNSSRRRSGAPTRSLDIFETDATAACPGGEGLSATTSKMISVATAATIYADAATWEAVADCVRYACFYSLRGQPPDFKANWTAYTAALNDLVPAASVTSCGTPCALKAAREDLRAYLFRGTEDDQTGLEPPAPTCISLRGLDASALIARLSALEGCWATAAKRARADIVAASAPIARRLSPMMANIAETSSAENVPLLPRTAGRIAAGLEMANSLEGDDSGCDSDGVGVVQKVRTCEGSGEAAAGGKKRKGKGWNELNGYWWKDGALFDIERLLSKKVERRPVGKRSKRAFEDVVYYKVLWADFPPEFASWEPETEIHNDFIDKYEAAMDAEAELQAEEEAEGDEDDMDDK